MPTTEAPTMQINAVTICKGSELTPSQSAALEGTEAEGFYAVRLERLTPEEAAAFLEARAGVQRGLADLEAGRVYSEDEAMRFILGDENE